MKQRILLSLFCFIWQKQNALPHSRVLQLRRFKDNFIIKSSGRQSIKDIVLRRTSESLLRLRRIALRVLKKNLHPFFVPPANWSGIVFFFQKHFYGLCSTMVLLSKKKGRGACCGYSSLKKLFAWHNYNAQGWCAYHGRYKSAEKQAVRNPFSPHGLFIWMKISRFITS